MFCRRVWSTEAAPNVPSMLDVQESIFGFCISSSFISRSLFFHQYPFPSRFACARHVFRRPPGTRVAFLALQHRLCIASFPERYFRDLHFFLELIQPSPDSCIWSVNFLLYRCLRRFSLTPNFNCIIYHSRTSSSRTLQLYANDPFLWCDICKHQVRPVLQFFF